MLAGRAKLSGPLLAKRRKAAEPPIYAGNPAFLYSGISVKPDYFTRQ